MSEPSGPARVDARIEGDVSGQIAVGSHIYQVGDVHGGVVHIVPPDERPALRPRPRPVHLRPRPFRGLVGRDDEAARARNAVRDCVPLEFHGTAGSGRTSLLRHLAHDDDTSAGAEDGLAWVSARGQALDGLLQELVGAFFESDGVVRRLTDAELRHALKDVRAVLLVDDVELGREDVLALADAAPGCALVFATDARRGWGDVQSVELGPLPLEAALSLWAREAGPIPDDRKEAVAAECERLGCLPLKVLQAAAAARAEERPAAGAGPATPGVAGPTADPAPEPDGDERRVLAVLAAMGAPMTATHVALASDLEPAAVEAALGRLLEQRRVELDSGRYGVTEPLPGLAREVEDDPSRRRRAVAALAAWASGRSEAAAQLSDDVPVLERALEWALESGELGHVEVIGRGLDAVLSAEGRWSAWARVLERVREAARAGGDRALEAWALHQRGSRALVLSRAAEAEAELGRALEIREELGDAAGAAVTRHNLEVGGFPVPDADLPTEPPGPGSPGRGWRPGMGSAAAGAVAVAGVAAFLLWPEGAELGLAATPDALAFPESPVGAVSDARTLTVSNGGSRPLRLGEVRIDPPGSGFSLVEDGCGGRTLPADGRCDLTLAFAPSAEGASRGRLHLARADGGAGLEVTLSGRGRTDLALDTAPLPPDSAPTPPDTAPTPPDTAPTPPVRRGELAADLDPVDFGSLEVGSRTRVPVVVRNAGPGPVRVVGARPLATGAFTVAVDGCRDVELQAAAACEVVVGFAPDGEGPARARLRVAVAEGSELDVGLLGVGAAPPPPPAGELSGEPAALRFGSTPVEGRELSGFRVANVGDGPVRIGALAVRGRDPGDFRILDQDCGDRVVGPGESCAVRIVFSPTAAGARSAEVLLRTSAGDGVFRVPMAGAGAEPARPVLSVAPTTLTFDPTTVPEGFLQTLATALLGPAREIALASRGNAPVEIRSVEVSGRHADDFDVAARACVEAGTLPPGASCTLEVRFRPRAAGQRVAQVDVVHGGEGGRATVRLVGVGTAQEQDDPEPPEPTGPPDLVVALQVRGGATAAPNGYRVPVRIVATNQGGTATSGVFKVAVETRTGVVPFQVPGATATWYAYRRQPLAAGARFTVDGTVLVRGSEGQTIPLTAFVDSCSGEEFVPAECHVAESNEQNNRSAPVQVRIPIGERRR